MSRRESGIPRKVRFVDNRHYPASGMATTVRGVNPVSALILNENSLDDFFVAMRFLKAQDGRDLD